MKVYLDISTLNRIFDDQSQARIYLEASAMLLIFMLIENEIVDIVPSDVLVYENEKNPYEERRIFVDAVLKMAKFFKGLDEEVLKRAEEVEQLGIKGMDSLHIACAEKIEVDCFVTCDDKIIKRYKGQVIVKTPVEFISDVMKEEADDKS